MKKIVFMMVLLVGCFFAEEAVGQKVQRSAKIVTKTAQVTQQKEAYKVAKLQFKAENPNATVAQRKAFIADMREKYPLLFKNDSQN